MLQALKHVAIFMAIFGGVATVGMLIFPFFCIFMEWVVEKLAKWVVKYNRWVNSLFEEKKIMVNDVVLTGKVREQFLRAREEFLEKKDK